MANGTPVPPVTSGDTARIMDKLGALESGILGKLDAAEKGHDKHDEGLGNKVAEIKTDLGKADDRAESRDNKLIDLVRENHKESMDLHRETLKVVAENSQSNAKIAAALAKLDTHLTDWRTEDDKRRAEEKGRRSRMALGAGGGGLTFGAVGTWIYNLMTGGGG